MVKALKLAGAGVAILLIPSALFLAKCAAAKIANAIETKGMRL